MDFEKLTSSTTGEPSSQIRERVIKARAVQAARYNAHPEIHCNAMLTPRLIREYCALDAQSKFILQRAMEKYDMSARAYDRILRVARTIADLADAPSIRPSDIAEAIGYRNLDRSTWGTTLSRPI